MTASASSMSVPLISFLVCTYHREDLIGPCLRSIAAQEGADQGDCEIVVVDNSDDSTSAEAVRKVAAELTIPVKYIAAHPANISVARNAGVLATQARYIAMIDDDMTVQVDWLRHARAAMGALPYDVFSGPVIPVYERPELANAQTRAFFHRQMQVSEATPLQIMGKGRTPGYIPATSNSIFLRESCFSPDNLFDEHYGKSGGEDLDLFCRLENQGRRIAWLPDIVTQELVPARRCDASYLEKRSFVGGQVYASAHILNSPHPSFTRLKLTLIAWAQLTILTLRSLVRGRSSGGPAHAQRMREAAVRGKLAWRHLVPFYQIEKKSS